MDKRLSMRIDMCLAGAMSKSSPEILVSDPSLKTPSCVIVGSHASPVISTGLRKVIMTPISK